MFIMGHKGSAGEKPENTLASIKAALKIGCPIIEVDVRLSSDGIPVLVHDTTLERTHALPIKVKDYTLKALNKRTAGSNNPICTLKEGLHEALPKAIVFIDIKDKGAGIKILELLAKPEMKKHAGNAVLSSTSARELIRIRNLNKKVKLALITKMNPFAFLAWEKRLGLTAVGFHRLHLPQLAIDAARKLDIFTYVYTVNRYSAVKTLQQRHIDAVVTDFPAKFISKLRKS